MPNETDNESKRKIKCPQCGRLTFYSVENPYRPFCSERCKLIDLGQWANEDFKIASDVPVDVDSSLNPDDFNPQDDENA